MRSVACFVHIYTFIKIDTLGVYKAPHSPPHGREGGEGKNDFVNLLEKRRKGKRRNTS